MKINTAHIDKIGKHLSYWLIPHEGNGHHPYSIRHQGLFLFVAGILISQIITNLFTGQPALTLGFATDIQKETLISLTNQQRQSSGAGVVVESPELSQAALMKAQDMFAKDYWAHVAPDGTTPWFFFNKVGYQYLYAGENLARGFQTSNGVIQGWMNSPSHKENMLNPNYKEIGMAVLNGQLSGESTTLVVQLFGTPQGSTASTTQNNLTQALSLVPSATPTPTPKPTPVAIATATSSQIIPQVTEIPQRVNPITRVLTSYQPNTNMTINQQVLLVGLLLLATILVVDSVVLIRKKILHHHSHTLIHALVIITLIGFILMNGKGLIL